jgi:hypothetical protein
MSLAMTFGGKKFAFLSSLEDPGQLRWPPASNNGLRLFGSFFVKK